MTWIMVSGIYDLGFGLLHLAFWHLLHWKEQLPRLSATNRSVVQALNLSLTSLLLLGAYLYLIHPADIGSTGIGNAVAVGMLLFWVGRTVQQVVLFDLRKWVHQLLLALFVLGIAVHSAAIWL